MSFLNFQGEKCKLIKSISTINIANLFRIKFISGKMFKSCELSGQDIMIYLNVCFFFLRVFHQITYSLCSDTSNY